MPHDLEGALDQKPRCLVFILDLNLTFTPDQHHFEGGRRRRYHWLSSLTTWRVSTLLSCNISQNNVQHLGRGPSQENMILPELVFQLQWLKTVKTLP